MKCSMLFVFVIMLVSCQAQKKTQNIQDNTVKTDTIKDSVEYYNVNIDVDQKNYLDQLYGTWNIVVMKRQAMMDAEVPTGVYVTLNKDMTFNGFAGCNRISGNYVVKGTGIKFQKIVSTKMACDKLEQESAFLKLLEETVSAYTVDNKKLLLRDGSSNIVFEGVKAK